MNKAGGILGILGGVFGFCAAIVTLFVGGFGAAFDAGGASTVIGLGWGGVLFAFLSIIFGAIAFSKPKGAGIGLIISSIAGAVLGGTLVAVCMALTLIGGILAVTGTKVSTETAVISGKTAEPIVTKCDGQKKAIFFGFVSGGVVAVAVVLVIVSINKQSASIGPSYQPALRQEDPLDVLDNGAPSPIQPNGHLVALFRLGSNNTDIQRENELNKIKGNLVSWKLPVYEVRRKGDGYQIQTSGNDNIGAFVYLTPHDDEDRRFVESLTTGQMIAFRGIIKGTFMRNLVIDPAVLEPIKKSGERYILPCDSTDLAQMVAPQIDFSLDKKKASQSDFDFVRTSLRHLVSSTTNPDLWRKKDEHNISLLRGDLPGVSQIENCRPSSGDSEFVVIQFINPRTGLLGAIVTGFNEQGDAVSFGSIEGLNP